MDFPHKNPKDRMTLDERMVQVHFMIADMWRTVHGNGQPGMIHRIAKLEERTTNPAAYGAVSGGVVGAIAVAIAAVLSYFGVG